MESLLIDQVLTLLPDNIRRGRRASLSPVENPSEQTGILRLTLLGEVDSVSFVVKRVSHSECLVHSLLSKEVPHLVPRLHATGEIKPNDWLLVMEDLSPPKPESVMDLTAMRSALKSLAQVHCRFANSTDLLRAAGVSTSGGNARDVGIRLSRALDLLIVLRPHFDMNLDEDHLRIAHEVALTLDSKTAPLIQAPRQTLVHGDFHFGNILRLSPTDVRIADWGSAAIQLPAWDLIMCSESEVDYYLDHTRRTDGFYQELRAAVLYRMAEFITAGMRLLFTSVGGIADTVPVCIERLIEAATATEFRGGRGVRFHNLVVAATRNFYVGYPRRTDKGLYVGR